jgi:hypothetical protein
MQILSFVILFPFGILLGIWYTSMLVLPLFYGVPMAFLGFVRKKYKFKAIAAYLVAPAFWTTFFILAFFLLAYFWESGFNYLSNSAAFNLGHILGSMILILNVLFNGKTKEDMRVDFEEFIAPYKI